ncbi:restriction endonuclease subunit S [Salmonella bongori]|uniref:restriction endonuclease subunit S n=1 Tax=Salmonella bongori TaxID=54736 RepID=UPI00127AD882|nr:restriction endonuclease subunit S [Salmonella bongori]ECG8257829.1 restriction endonuclease subunit S [Salmonella bongori serovar 48:i:-]ECG9252980.1 restriction endonuclease subunit S [Salmonella bongori]EDP8706213.1 restriction endonuclease subunit S [Salmonella bongori]EDP8726099.1 restriction endonuclease subunit S [Salmonella bongori]EEO9370559.1 restriction endonuclease subunit S [Salmonella bongori]
MTEQQLPEGWQMVKFGDIAKHISKRVEPSETDLEIYVGLEHLDPDSLKIKRHGTPSDVEGQKLLVKKGQIIFGKRRAYQRKIAVADWDCICSAHAMVLEANSKNILPEFLPFFMQSDVFMERAIAISEGSLSPTIKWKVLAEQKFIFPNKDKQELFIKLIKVSDKVLISSQESLNSFVKLKRAISNDYLFGNRRLPGTSGEWKKVKLKEIGEFKSGLTYSPDDVTQDTNGLLVLRSSNIQDYKLALDDNVYVSRDVPSNLLSRPNDILICVRNGSKHLIGKSALVTAAAGHATHGAFMSLFRTDDFRFVFHLFQSQAYRKQVLRNLGATINSINGKDLSNFIFMMPEKKERDMISDFLEKLDVISAELSLKVKQAQEIKNVLLSRIFNI